MYGRIYIDDAVNWDAPLNRGLISWWSALPDLNRGIIWRDLCRRNDGTLTGTSWPPTSTSGWGPSDHPGSYGTMRFDGSNDYVACGAATNLDMTGDMTFSGWVYVTTWSDSAHHTFVSKGNHGSNTVNYLFGKTDGSFGGDSNSLKFTYNDGSFRDVVCSGSVGVLNSATWYFLTTGVRKTAAEVDFYANGALLDTVADGNGLNYGTNNGPLRIGINGSAGEALNGRANDMRLYSRALSAAEVLALYRASCAGYEREMNWVRPWCYPGGISTGNRRRRVLLGAAA